MNCTPKSDHIAVVAPSTPAALIAPAVHKQAMGRIRDHFELPPVEYPSVREMLSARKRAEDINNASANVYCKAIFAVVGGNDSIRLTKYLDREILIRSKVPYVGYSDNTAIHNFLWKLGRTSYYGGSTQVQLGPGPYVDSIQLLSLRKVLKQSGSLELRQPFEYEVRGKDWCSSQALSQMGIRAPYPEYLWAGDSTIVHGSSWGGCIQTLLQIAIMNGLPTPEQLQGAVIFLELSDEKLGDGNVLKFIRAFGERGYFNHVGAVLFGLPPHAVNDNGSEVICPNPEAAIDFLSSISDEIGQYNPNLLRVLGLPIGHVRPQYIIPYGGKIEVDGINKRVTVIYDE